MRRSPLSLLALSAVAAVALLALVSAPVAVQAEDLQWGFTGHYITAAIAEGYLSTSAKAACKNILPSWAEGSIGKVASWADSSARSKYPWSGQLHYADTPEWKCNYDQARDCHGGVTGEPMACVDGAIQNYTKRILDKSLSDLDRGEALMFLVHFVGDIHQPLHTGFTTDQGGNLQKGTFCGVKGRKLHQIWDDDMISKRIKDDFNGDNAAYMKYFEKELAKGGKYYIDLPSWERPCASVTKEPYRACSSQWAEESTKLACSTAYVDQYGKQIKTGFDLDQGYQRFAIPVVEMQLAKGGVRLANVLNAMFSAREESTARYHAVTPEQFKAARQQEQAERRAERAQKATEYLKQRNAEAAKPTIALE